MITINNTKLAKLNTSQDIDSLFSDKMSENKKTAVEILEVLND